MRLGFFQRTFCSNAGPAIETSKRVMPHCQSGHFAAFWFGLKNYIEGFPLQ